MKIKLLLATFGLLLVSYQSYCVPADSAAVQQQFAALQDSMNNGMQNVYDSMQAQFKPTDYVDQSVIDSLRQNPCVLYKGTDCENKWIYQVGGWILFALILVGGLFLFATTGLCKDDCLDPNGNLKPLKKRPYSYSRVQLFWWTMIILCCYVAFFALYGSLVPLNMTTVLLLGLGSVVYAAGKIIDERQKQQNPIGTRNQDRDASHDSFFMDILSDDGGISIHRFQTLIFNVAFGVGFVAYFVASHCTGYCRYPFMDFNEWQFALLGISSATYLGLKAAENNPATPPAGNNPTTPPVQDPSNPGTPQQ